jgi:hypothetical protein
VLPGQFTEWVGFSVIKTMQNSILTKGVSSMNLLSSLICLHASFFNRFGLGTNLIHYLAQPRIDNNSFNFEAARQIFIRRQQPDKLDDLNCVPQDVQIFKKRADVLANNNKAYRIAMTDNPSITDLEQFATISPGWSLLYPVKVALMQHYRDWHAIEYKGLVPFGSAVIAYVNSLELGHKKIGNSPDLQDHIYLQKMCNREAQFREISSQEMNNRMYLAGLKLLGIGTAQNDDAENN